MTLAPEPGVSSAAVPPVAPEPGVAPAVVPPVAPEPLVAPATVAAYVDARLQEQDVLLQRLQARLEEQDRARIRSTADVLRALVQEHDRTLVQRVTETGGDWSQADPLLNRCHVLSHGDASCLVVVFEEQAELTTRDMEWVRDAVVTCATAGRVNAAMVLAVRAPFFPEHGVFDLDRVSGIPMVYAAGLRESAHLLLAASKSLWFAWRQQMPDWNDGAAKRYLSEQVGKEVCQVRSCMHKVMQCYRTVADGIADRRSYLANLTDRLNLDEARLTEFLQEFDQMQRYTQWLTVRVDEDDPTAGMTHANSGNAGSMAQERLVHRILQYHASHSKWPRRKDVGVSESEVRALGGFRALLKRAKNRA